MTGYMMGCCRVRASCLSSSRLNRLVDGRHFLSTSSANPKEDELDYHQKSKRQQFRETPVHPSIVRYIEMIGVGIPSRRKKSKRLRNHLFDHLEEGRRSNRQGSATKPPPPFSTESRRVVVIGSVSTTEDTFPTNKEVIPEVALAGRSNVGKSTLLNALLYGNKARYDNEDSMIRKYKRGVTPENVKLPKGIKAVVSDKPGETRKITFYQLLGSQGEKLRLVDLPGYGFSFTPRDHDGFQDLLLQYLLERGKALKRVLLLIDARHGLKKADLDFIISMEEESRRAPERKMPAIQIVLTKSDLVTRDDLARRVVHVRQELSDTLRRETSSLPVLLVSARAGVGFNNVRKKGGGPGRARGGVLELQKELGALVPKKSGKAPAPHTPKSGGKGKDR